MVARPASNKHKPLSTRLLNGSLQYVHHKALLMHLVNQSDGKENAHSRSKNI